MSIKLGFSNGKLIWQRFTLQSKIYEDIMTLKTSDLVENDNSIYFSNNALKPFLSVSFSNIFYSLCPLRRKK